MQVESLVESQRGALEGCREGGCHWRARDEGGTTGSQLDGRVMSGFHPPPFASPPLLPGEKPPPPFRTLMLPGARAG